MLVVSSEYSTGGIRTSLTAVPNRMRLLAAKVGVFAAVSFVIGLGTGFVAFFSGQPWFSERGIGATLGDPGVLRAVIGAGLYLTASGLFGLACAVLLRHTAGAITLAVGFLLYCRWCCSRSPAASAMRSSATSPATPAADHRRPSDPELPHPVGRVRVFCLWFAVPLAAGAYLMQRRDA